MMTLPASLERDFEQELIRFEEENRMPYILSFERRALQARQEGILQSSREDLLEVLRVRFENVPNLLEEAINQIEDDLALKTLLRQAITIGSLEEFQRYIDQLTSVDKGEDETEKSYSLSFERRALQARQEDILEILRVRFETVPDSLEEVINQIEDDSVLKTLHRQAIAIGSLEEFQQEITRLTWTNEGE
jgi:hypothetical protein